MKHHVRRTGKDMGSSAARPLSHGEKVAQRLAHDEKLMASITEAMEDVRRNRVLTVEEFARRLGVASKDSAAFSSGIHE